MGWVLFVVMHRLASGRTTLWAPFDLIPPFLLAAVPLLLLAVAPLARPVRWRLVGVLVAAGMLGAASSGLNPAALWYDPPPAPSDAITVVTWNTEFWDQDWRNSNGRAFNTEFYSFLSDLDADVYLLSEYLHVDTSAGDLSLQWSNDLALRIDKLPELRRHFPDYEVAVVGEQVTLSRLPIVAQRGLDLRPWLPAGQRETPPELRDFPESYSVETLRTDIEVSRDLAVSFYNADVLQPPLEWQIYRSGARAANRDSHARRVASFEAIQKDIDGNRNPVVLGGDLNTSPAMGMRRLFPDNLVDHTRALSSVYPATWLAGEFELWRLDWLLTTPDITVHSYELIEAEGLSDHRPQRAVLSVTG